MPKTINSAFNNILIENKNNKIKSKFIFNF